MKFKAIIDRFESDKAVLILTGGREIIFSREMLDPDAAEGDELNFEITKNISGTAEKYRRAKNLLRKITAIK